MEKTYNEHFKTFAAENEKGGKQMRKMYTKQGRERKEERQIYTSINGDEEREKER